MTETSKDQIHQVANLWAVGDDDRRFLTREEAEQSMQHGWRVRVVSDD